VLRTFGADDPQLIRLSDDVCSALQVIEHLQDVGEDWRAGRVYVPQEDLFAFNCTEQALGAAAASAHVRSLVAFEAVRCRELLRSGRRLVRALHGWSRLAITGFVAGGAATLDAIERAEGDVLAVACRPRRGRVVAQACSLLFGKDGR
jgi:phytoene/squalene synthetase